MPPFPNLNAWGEKVSDTNLSFDLEGEIRIAFRTVLRRQGYRKGDIFKAEGFLCLVKTVRESKWDAGTRKLRE